MGRKIFIVENEFIIAEDLRMMVEQLGYAVVGMARSVTTAKEQISEATPELVLLDVQLSGKMDGLELARWLKERGIPFVFVTSFSDAATRQTIDKTAPTGYLAKPFDQQDIESTLARAFAAVDHHKP